MTLPFSSHFFPNRSKIKELKEKGKQLLSSKVEIVLAGDTGCGKSSLINALLKVQVLPTSGEGEGCTSVPVQVTESKDTDRIPRYRAEVNFLTKEEWESELEAQLALADDRNEPNWEEAVQTLSSVYGKNYSKDSLSTDKTVNNMLVEELKIISEEVSTYVASMHKKGGCEMTCSSTEIQIPYIF